MLLGTYLPKLDDKSRLIIPAKFRAELSGGLVMTKGIEKCVYVYSDEEFEKLHLQMAEKAPQAGKAGRDYLRVFLGSATSETPDTQSRVTIPPMLRQWANLDRELTVIGAGTRAEIWDTPTWETYSAEAEAGYLDADGEVIAGLF